ncbi:class II fumarate hydratase [bacterium]|nr:class II fumarate hydratase [bacterium]
MAFRKERDSLGVVKVPEDKLYGASTQRAVENFKISSLRFSRPFIRAFASVKRACAQTNLELGLLEPQLAQAISSACDEIAKGTFDSHFVVDVFQTGSGTSTNMNFNEVIAQLASQKTKKKVHPNDHVNKGQSSNDIFPTVMHVVIIQKVVSELLPALHKLEETLQKKADRFKSILKVGRTHLQDAAPLSLGQVFSGYQEQIKKAQERLERASSTLLELAVGGTAVGTGINTHPQFGKRVVAHLNRESGYQFKEAKNHFEAQACQDSCVEMSGALKTVAVSLTKIANDIRWLACGPRAGLGEIEIPAVQPGSSIMPGKVNPVIPEAVLQVCAKVIGNDATITWAGASGNFELNTMMPVIAFVLLESVEILAEGTLVFEEKCVRGIEPNSKRIQKLLEDNLMLATPLALVVGYDQATAIAQTAWKEQVSIREVARRELKLSDQELSKILDPRNMIQSKK